MGETKVKRRQEGKKDFEVRVHGIRKSNVSGNTEQSAKNKIKKAYPESKVISEKRKGSVFGFKVKKR